jgi:hypothetical protein
MGVQKLCEEFLEGIVLEATFRLGPETGSLFINLKCFRVIILMGTADKPFC